MKAANRTNSPNRRSIALVVWTIAVAAMTLLVWLRPQMHTVYTIYSDAGRQWIHGTTAYVSNWHDEYRYSPIVTVFFTTLGSLPDAVGGILWRWLGVALMVGGFAYACRAIYPHWAESSRTDREWLWLMILPFSIANLHNGQANLHMLGLLLIAVAAVRRERWNLAAVCLAAACFLKIYPISLALLFVAIYPLRLGPRLLVALALGTALPFLAQSTGHVLDEYRIWIEMMAGDDRFIAGRTTYRDLALLLQLAHVPIVRSQYLIVEAAAGVVAALVCLVARWRLGWTSERMVPFVYAIGTFWMLLCGPSTESSTYILIAPLAAWLVLDAFRGRMAMPSRILVIAGSVLVHFALFASAFPFGRAVHDLGLHPFGALVMAIGFFLDRFGPESRALALHDVAREQPR
jgi:hypothetical protein